MRFPAIQLTILSLLTMISCLSKNEEIHSTLWINSYKVNCQGIGPMTCLQYSQEDVVTTWSNFYSTIEGFDYEPGYLYKIEISTDTLPPELVPADASSIRYTLVKVLDKQKDPKLRINDIWALELINGEEPKLDVGIKLPYLEFQLASGRVMGTNGCNQLTGRLKSISDNSLEFGPFVETSTICYTMELADSFNDALSKVGTYSLDKGTLSLSTAEGIELMRFKKVD